MDIENIIEQYHKTLDDFSKGNPHPFKQICSIRDDIALANPWGPHARGWKKVSEKLDFASSRFRDGWVTEIQTIATYSTPELVTIYELETWNAKVSGRDQVSTFDLRVTSTFRKEDGVWKLIHRHADPITTEHPDGPLRYAK